MSKTNNPTVVVAKEIAAEKDSDQVITLKSGVNIRLMPVSTALIEEVVSRIVDPDVPMWFNEQKNRNEPNPNDPAYVKALSAAERERGVAVMDAIVMFGVELVDGLPQDSAWLKKLKYLEKRGQLNLSTYDLEDPFDQEFLYKRFIVVDNDTMAKISRLSAFTQEDVERAERQFQGDEAR